MGEHPNLARDRAELENLRSLFINMVPTSCAHRTGVAKLAVRDQETGETKAADWVELWTFTPMGPQLQYLEPDDAEALANILLATAKQARTGIIAVSAGAERHL